MGVKTYPDNVSFDPNFADSTFKAGDTMSGGRFMNAGPHVDGLIIMSPAQLEVSGPNALTLTRNGKGDWSLNRTAAAAETYYVRTTLAQLLRTGETYNFGDYNENIIAAPDKGIEIVDFFAIKNAGVVALTSATLRLGKSVYRVSGAAAAAPVQTDLVAATAITTAINAAGAYITDQVAGPNPLVFHKDDLGLVEIELEAVMANTGTLRIAGIGAHVNFNYD